MIDRGPSSGDASHVVSGGFICLAPVDNVLIATRSIVAGEQFVVDGTAVTVEETVPIGYKIARFPLEIDDEVVRFGMPIGRMTQPADIGTLIHTHNLASNYLPSTERH